MTPKPAAVLFVADVQRMTTFYRQLAGMTLAHSEPGYAVLVIAGFQLVLHALHGDPAAQAASSGIVVRDDSYHKLCSPVASLEAARRSPTASGVHLHYCASAIGIRSRCRDCSSSSPE